MSLLFHYHHERCPYLPKVMLSPGASCDCEKYEDEGSAPSQMSDGSFLMGHVLNSASGISISIHNDGPTHRVKAKIREVLLDEFGNVIAAAPWPEDDKGEDA